MFEGTKLGEAELLMIYVRLGHLENGNILIY
jgi:hypothetical protein